MWNRILLNILKNVKPARQIKKSNCKEPLSPHPIVDRPWEKIATDFFYCNGSDWLVVIDFYSNWIELAKMRSKNISAVKEILLKMFTRNGVEYLFRVWKVVWNLVDHDLVKKNTEKKRWTSKILIEMLIHFRNYIKMKL